MNNVEQLQSYSLGIISSISFMTLTSSIMLKEEIPSPSHGIYMWHHRFLLKAMHKGQFIFLSISLLQKTLSS